MEDLARIFASLAVGLGGGGALIAYVKDRRKSKAEGQVASATVELQIDAKKLENAEARLTLTQRAWDAERRSFESRIKRLEDELREERQQSDLKDGKIRNLEARVSEIQTSLLSVTRELADLRRATP